MWLLKYLNIFVRRLACNIIAFYLHVLSGASWKYLNTHRYVLIFFTTWTFSIIRPYTSYFFLYSLHFNTYNPLVEVYFHTAIKSFLYFQRAFYRSKPHLHTHIHARLIEWFRSLDDAIPEGRSYRVFTAISIWQSHLSPLSGLLTSFRNNDIRRSVFSSWISPPSASAAKFRRLFSLLHAFHLCKALLPRLFRLFGTNPP